MKLQLKKDFNDVKAESVVECDEVQGEKLLKEGIAQEYKEKAIDQKEIELAVKEQVEKALVGDKKMDMEKKDTEFAIGKMFKYLATKTITGNSETGSATTGPEIIYTGLAELAPLVMQNSVVYAKCRKIPIAQNANAMKLPIDTSDFVIKATAPIITNPAEAVAPTATNLTFTSRTLTLTKSAATIALTEELLEDNASIDAWVRADLVGKLANTLDYEILKGGGGGYTAINGDTNYCVATALSGPPTVSEYQALMNYVHPQMNPEFFMSITDWVLACNTFGTAANVMNQLIDIQNKKLFGKNVTVVPCLASGDVLFGDLSHYTVLEGKLGDRITVSNDVRFYEGEIVMKIAHRGAGSLSYYKRATGDSKFVASFAEKS